MKSLPRMALLVLLAVLSLTSGCKRHRPTTTTTTTPKDPVYTISFKKDVTPVGMKRPLTIANFDVEGATLVVDGVEAGIVTERSAAEVSVSTTINPAHSFVDHSVKLALRFPTPCGTAKDVELTDYTTNETAVSVEPVSHVVDVKLGAGASPPSGQSAIWVDDQSRPNAKVTFGTIDVTGAIVASDTSHAVPGRRKVIWDVTCAPEHEVKIDGIKVGVAKSTGELASAFLVSTDPSACYQRVNHRYSTAYDMNGPGSGYFDVPPGQVNAIRWVAIDYFLRPAPAGLTGQFSDHRTSLERVTCKRAANR